MQYYLTFEIPSFYSHFSLHHAFFEKNNLPTTHFLQLSAPAENPSPVPAKPAIQVIAIAP